MPLTPIRSLARRSSSSLFIIGNYLVFGARLSVLGSWNCESRTIDKRFSLSDRANDKGELTFQDTCRWFAKGDGLGIQTSHRNRVLGSFPGVSGINNSVQKLWTPHELNLY
ncbi:hypothetical protein GGU11DRAFT_879950 [Lentinula aff. detonsa]|nr:hypothetical protein GGU11DRAFT_879950 [Lentinula aff. detonsa]